MACGQCRTLFQPTPGADFFELLGVERGFEIDGGSLSDSFHRLARLIHPDRYSSADEQTRQLATALFAQVNQAYTALGDPARRADYLLTLAGGPSAAAERAVPGDLLAQVMALREQIDEARDSGDLAVVENIRNEVSVRRAQTLQRVSPLAAALDQADEPHKRELRLHLNAIRYFDTLLQQVAPDPFVHASGAGRG